MAVDKLVDSTQLDADLTSVANAIRTKGGTSAQMAFPAGFVSAVNAIPTGGGNKPGTWNRPNYVPDITDFVVEQENTAYISCENTAANKADTNSRIRCPVITSVDVTVLHDDGTTETQTITDFGISDATSSYIQMAKMPLGNILIKITPNIINLIPFNDYGTDILIYEIYVFGSQSASADLSVMWNVKSYLLHLFIKKVKFTSAFKCAYSNDPDSTINKRSAYRFEFYDCDFSEVTSFSQCMTMTYYVDYTFAPLNLSNTCTIFDYAFSEFGGKLLDLSQCDLSGATNTTGMFRQYRRSNAQLSDLRMWKAPMISFDISPLPNLTVESLMSVINALQTVSTTQTITLGTTLRNKLTADQIAIATAKGWTVA